MGQALYRKYRSKHLSEIVGQEHITTTLQNALEHDAISHAYLFTGPRGVGKTSIARILAHEVNGFPYDDSAHLDIIEIDAASNRRIDEIRDLREHVHSAPTSGKYKVYIIDEVHMLTKEAFNALLKTLEEPPEHVIFILATTEAHKLPETIISRTQRFTFKPVETDQAVAHLRSIAETESVDIDDEALALIAEHGGGSFRDSISLLDQVSSGRSSVTIEHVRSTLGIAPDAAVSSLITALEVGSMQVVLQTLYDLRMSGYHTPLLAKQLAAHLRQQLLSETNTLPRQTIITLLQQLIDVPSSHDPDVLLELILIEHVSDQPGPTQTTPIPESTSTTPSKPKAKAETVEPSQKQTRPEIDKTHVEQVTETPVETVEDAEPVVTLAETPPIMDENTWQEALSILKKRHNTLYGIARMASPTFADNTATLSFTFPFHKKRLEDSKNKQILSDILTDLMKTPVRIVCILDPTSKSVEKPMSAATSNADLDAISNIFGEAEVIE